MDPQRLRSTVRGFTKSLLANLSPRVWQELFWIVLGQVAATIGAIASVRVLTEMLTPAEYGNLALGLTGVMLVQQVALAGVSGAAERFYFTAAENGTVGSYIRGLWLATVTRTVITAALLVAAIFVLCVLGKTRLIPFVCASALFAVLTSYAGILDSIQNAARRRQVVALHQGISPWLRVLIAFGMVVWLGPAADIVMWGFAAGACVTLMSQVAFLVVHIKHLVPPTAAKPIELCDWAPLVTRYSWPFAIWGVPAWLQMSSDRWALEGFEGGSMVGLYAVVFQVGYYPISMVHSFVMKLVGPIIFSRVGDGRNHDRVCDAVNMNLRLVVGTCVMAIVAVIVTVGFHREIFRLLVAPSFYSASAFLPIAVLSSGVFAVGQVLSLMIYSGTELNNLIAPKIITALFGVALNFGGAYLYGIKGVLWAGVIFGAAYLAWVTQLAWPTLAKAIPLCTKLVDRSRI